MMVSRDAAIGIDIGGSATKLGIITKDGELVASQLILTPATMTAKMIMQAICAQLDEIITEPRVRALRILGVGISICGYLEADGEAPDYINLHALEHYPVVRDLRERYELQVVMDNDMNCGVLGEYYFGGGKGEQRLMVMTVGTGVGMGMIIDGKVLRIHGGTVGNPGHIIVDANGPICDAGCRGCLESIAAARAISRRAEDVAQSQRKTTLSTVLQAKGRLSPTDVLEAAEGGDEAAKEIWTETGKWLGRGLASWTEIFGPEVVIVGGGIALAGDWLLKPLIDEFYRCGEPYFTRRVREIKKSELGQNIAMLGAASMILFPENAPKWKARR